MSGGGEILEGFLCPLCMKDLGDVIQLQIHFEENHSKEDQAFLQSIKDLFGKAKKKILSDEDQQQLEGGAVTGAVQKVKYTSKLADDNIHPVSGIRTDLYPKLNPAQSTPSKSSHYSYLKKIRSERVDRYAAETNRLIVRLDRLLENMPSDAGKRRTHEQTIVDWIDESLVKLCPSCTKSFNITRRKHHCRLCGSVMCKDCSKFVEWSFCRKLINPSTLSIYSMKKPERQGWSVNGGGNLDTRSVGSPQAPSIRRPSLLLRRSGSKESLLSVSESRTAAEEFRVCEYCDKLLRHRDAAIELQTSKPIVTQFYDRLKAQMVEGEELSEKYSTMWESLCRGETTYHLEDAKTLRLKLLKIGESVDLISKKIADLGKPEEGGGAEDPNTTPTAPQIVNSRKILLQNQIRRASVNFVKDTLVGLPSLPSQERFEELKKRRQEETARRVEEERRKAKEAKLRFQNLQEKRQDPSPRLPHSASDQSIKYEKGFVLTSSEAVDTATMSSDDPMIQQMNIIRNYIKRAREANRFDEVGILESNLRELQLEYQRGEEERKRASEEEAQKAVNTPREGAAQKAVNTSSSHTDLHLSDNNSTNPFFTSEDEQEDGRQGHDTEDSMNTTTPSTDNSTSSEFTLSTGGDGAVRKGSMTTPNGGIGHGSSAATSPGFVTTNAASAYGKELAAKPVLNEVATAFRNVRNNLSNKNLLTSFNPFGTTAESEEDEYDASGKNPFSE
eukprot:TRINITY_DN8254_c0_g2_i12.p1 TRINITY_DN8254_c0_g2~~TRINITY_DN8254_c0_g2_i12.p1  ORF type:complete len:729 (-),score=207.47 TRINITY_DN8254_c0_g2_i12:337-2523(-)